MFALRLTQTVDDGLAHVERWLAIVLTAALTGIMMTQVVMRYFFNAPLFWAEEVAVQLLVFMTLIGLSLLVRSERLVSVDFLPQALSERNAHWLKLLLGIAFLVLLLFLAKLGWEWVSRADVRMERGATVRLPRWYNYSVLPAAMIAMSWHQFAAVVRHTRAAITASVAGRAAQC